MRILYVGKCVTQACLARRNNGSYYSPAGTRKMLAVAAALAAKGHKVDIFSLSYARKCCGTQVEHICDGVRIIHSWTLGFAGKLSCLKRPMGTLAATAFAFRNSSEYDLAMCYNYRFEFSLPLLLLRRHKRIPFVLDYEDGLFLKREYSSRRAVRHEKAVYTAMAGVVLVNPGLADRIREISGTDPDERHIVHGLFDRTALRNAPTTRTVVIRNLLFSGNYSKDFGFRELVEYAENLPAGMQLHITGKGDRDETNRLRSLSESRANVCFHGFVSDHTLGELKSRADAMVLLNNPDSPFNRTNFPSKLFEHLSDNQCIVTTANPLLERYFDLDQVTVVSLDAEGLRRIEGRRVTMNKDALVAMSDEQERCLSDFMGRARLRVP